MYTQDWLEAGGVDVLHNFIKFWSNWTLPVDFNHLLLICLSFTYTKENQANFFKRWFMNKNINHDIKIQLEQLESQHVLEKFAVNGVVLPELVNVGRKDVYEWAEGHLRSTFDVLKPELDEILKKSPDAKIAMCDLAPQLKKILEKYSIS